MVAAHSGRRAGSSQGAAGAQPTCLPRRRAGARAHAAGAAGAVAGSDAQHWINLAVVCQGLRDEGGEERAIRGALSVDPSDLLGLLLRADLLERQGQVHAAASAYGAAARVAPPLAQLNPSLRPAVQRALAFRARYEHQLGTHLDQFLEPYLEAARGEQVGRFRDSVDIMLGRKHRHASQSALYHYPGWRRSAFSHGPISPGSTRSRRPRAWSVKNSWARWKPTAAARLT